MTNEPSIADIKSAFAEQVSTLPPPAGGRHATYRPRTSARTVGTACLGAAAVSIASVAVALAAMGHEVDAKPLTATQETTPSTVDLLSVQVTLPALYRTSGRDCVSPTGVTLVYVSVDGGVVMNSDGSCMNFTWAGYAGALPPVGAEPIVLGGVAGWTWLVGADPAYALQIPATAGHPWLLVLVQTHDGKPTRDEVAAMVAPLKDVIASARRVCDVPPQAQVLPTAAC